MPPEEDRATVTGDLHKNFVKIGIAVSEICSRTDRQTETQTNRQTDMLIAILRSPTGAK